MIRSLPTAPSLEHLKKQAKDLLKLHRNKDPKACKILKTLHQFQNLSNEKILNSKLSLNETQFALSLDYGFKSWTDLKKHVLGRTANLKFLHIHDGDISANLLKNSHVPGDNLVWREIYLEGPVPGKVSEEEFKKIRAKFISQSMRVDYKSLLQGTNTRYALLAEAGKYEEIVLWFDPCLFDQTIMIHLIEKLSQMELKNTKLSLICIGEFPCLDQINGFGNLTPEQMASLLDARHEITSEEISLAGKAWKAFTSDNPEDIENILADDCSTFPYLKSALTRHLEQYPSLLNGLNRTQNQILKTVASGAKKLGKIFTAVSEMEKYPFMGDSSFWACIDELANCKKALLEVKGPARLIEVMNRDPELYDIPSIKELKRWDVNLTDFGKEILAGKQDYIQLNGVDRWLGGVHLQGNKAQWRWDEENRKLVEEHNFL